MKSNAFTSKEKKMEIEEATQKIEKKLKEI